MSDTVTLKGNNQSYSGRLILTNYGRERILQRIAEGIEFDGFNFTSIILGDKLNNSYTPAISDVGNKTVKFEISDENVTQNKNTVTIETNLDLDGEFTIQEIGLYETIENKDYLFAYASGFSMIKGKTISYDLIIDLSLALTFENEHYSRFNTVLDDSEYALSPVMDRMFVSLTETHLDLERCVEINSRELSYNKAQAFMTEQQKISNILRNILLFGRYEKTISKLGLTSMTDCFYYPSEKPVNYIIKNLRDEVSNIYEDVFKNRYTLYTPLSDDEDAYFVDSQGTKYAYVEVEDAVTHKIKIGIRKSTGVFVELTKLESSVMKVSGSLQICNRDNIDLSKAASIIYTTTLNKITTENIILGKLNPNEDEYYFDFRVIYDKDRAENGLQFTIYSYDYKKAKNKTYTDERELVGHYRIKYFPPSEEKVTIAENETMFSFIYNGDIENPQVLMYVNTKLVNNAVEDKVVRCAFTYKDNNGVVHKIYTDRNGAPLALFNADGTPYIGNEFIIKTGSVYYVDSESNEHIAEYTPSDDITVAIDRFIIDNFNYMGPCEDFKDRCTLRNYTQTVSTGSFKKPMYYMIPEVDNSSIVVFNKELSEQDILYLSLISKS